MDTGTTSGAAAEGDIEALEKTGLPSTKVFMLLDKSKIRSTQKKLPKHKLREGTREMNVVPGLYSTLVSIPKMADSDYIAVFNKHKATINDATTTKIKHQLTPLLLHNGAKPQDSGNLTRTQQSKKHKMTQYSWQQQKWPTQFLTYPTTNKPCCTTTLRQAFPQKKPSLTQYEQGITPRGQS